MASSAVRPTLALLAGLVLSCGGGASPAPASAPVPAPRDVLYSASARDYDFDFDGRVWEVERHEQGSYVRECVHPKLSMHSFFAIGCWGELTRLRGYEYSWQLQSKPIPCRIDPSQQDREYMLAFTHEPSAYEIPPRMLRAWIGPGSFQWSSDASDCIELARQHLGHRPTKTP